MERQPDSYWQLALKLVMSTLPMMGVNAAVYGGFFIVSLIWFGIWGGVGVLFAKMGLEIFAYICLLIALGAGGWIVRFLRRYLLYIVKGAHIALMTRMLKGEDVPKGIGQFQEGREHVEELFKDVSMLFGVNELVNGALRAIQGTVLSITNMLPLPDFGDNLIRIATTIVNRAARYVDEAILSYSIYTEEENVWNSARHGMILYAQSYKPILWTASKVWLLGRAVDFIAFGICIVPAVLALYALAIQSFWAQLIVLVLAGIGAWAIEKVVFEPFALAYMMVTYHYSIAGQQPDPEWDERLKNASDSFRQLFDKAKEAGSTAFEKAPAPSPKSVQTQSSGA